MPVTLDVRDRLAVWAEDRGRVAVRFVGRCPRVGREEILARVAAPPPRVAELRQIHSADLRPAAPGYCGRGDALATSRADLALSVITADCLPILVVAGDEVRAVHAGWRGLAAGVIAEATQGLPATDAHAWIGPAIGPCCYEVGSEVADAVADAVGSRDVVRSGPGTRPHLDLPLAGQLALAAAGVRGVTTIAACTRCLPGLLWSYRRDGAKAGRNVAYVWRRSSPGDGVTAA